MKDFKKNIARNISNYMDSLCIKQIELAKMLGCSNTTISMWMHGNAIPRMDKVDKMCEIFHCERQDLLRDEPKTKDEIEDEQITESFTNMFKGFDASQRLRIIAYMQKLKEEQK